MPLVLISLGALAVGAVTSLIFCRAPRISVAISMIAIGAAAMLGMAASLSVLLGSTAPALAHEASWLLPMGTARLALDALSAWFLMTVSVLALCVAIYTPAYMRPAAGEEPAPSFGPMMCLFVASLVLVVCAADAILFLVAWEALSLSAFFLISTYHGRPEVRHGAWMYLVATHIGTALCVVPLFGFIVALAKTTSFTAFPDALATTGGATATVLFGLGLAGFGVKAGILPMHVWLPEAHPVAPTPVSALLSGVVVKIGIYGILRLLTWIPSVPPVCGYALLALGVLSGVMGVLYALAQHDLKRLLAYHTVENIGIIAIGIAVGMLGQAAHKPGIAMLGYAGALLHVANHALFKGLLFLSAGAVLHGTGTVEIERLGGLAKKTPVNALLFLVGAVAICGLPPLNGFVSEWVIYGGMFKGAALGIHVVGVGSALGILSLALMGGLALACFAKVFGVIFLGEPRDAAIQPHRTPITMKLGMAILALCCVLIGLAPGLWAPLTYFAAGSLAHASHIELAESIRGLLSMGSRLSTISFVLIALAAGLAILRATVLGRAGAALAARAPVAVDTWGCGYARPAARMQYTATSFASMLILSFRGVLWPERELVRPAGVFPASSSVETHVTDLAEHEVFEPLFRYAARFAAMVRTLSWNGSAAPHHSGAHPDHRPLKTLAVSLAGAVRRGAIQAHLLFIVLTLLVLFLIEGFSARDAAHPAQPPDPSAPAIGETHR